ncbi:hypothetical protein IKW75_03165 [Candidatus Saccharibacteria bacterium]|nr:hypothetical protein [Candidatus Saccharibacteria bacterium]
MIKKIIAVVLALVLGVSLVGITTVPAFAENDYTKEACEKITDAGQRAALGCDDNNQTVPIVVTNIIRGIISVLGVVAVVVIVVAGQRYIVAQGDPGKITAARNMLIYAVVGLVIAILSFAIVSFLQTNIFR